MERLYLSERDRPLWSKIVGSFFFAGMFLCLYRFIYGIILNAPDLLDFVFIVVGLVAGMLFTMTTNYIFDIQKGRFKDEKQIGPIKFGLWEPIFSFEYVAITKAADNLFVLNLWIKGNDHFPIGGYENEKIALEKAEYIAKKLNIHLWNSTDIRNGFWQDLS